MKKTSMTKLVVSALVAGVALVASSVLAAADFRFEKDVQRYEKISQETPPTPETTFFVGSSTFTGWKEIPNDFQSCCAINRGFGGSQISDWLDVAADRILTPYKPNRIVFFCGCNDIASGKTPESVVEDFKTFLQKMRDANPNVVVHVCALHMPPSRKKHWVAFKTFNAAVKDVADQDERVFYVDFAAATSDENGQGRPELFKEDQLHLTRDAEKILVPLVLESIQREKDALGR